MPNLHIKTQVNFFNICILNFHSNMSTFGGREAYLNVVYDLKLLSATMVSKGVTVPVLTEWSVSLNNNLSV